MNERAPDITGNKYGKLTAIRRNGRKGKRAMWLFLCDCGNEKTLAAANVRSGTKSCGCATGYEDLTGRIFGTRTVTSRAPSNSNYGNSMWNTSCKNCGSKIVVRASDIRSVSACKCVLKTAMGDAESPEYKAWNQAIIRCHNPKSHNYNNYGARGISVCDEWRSSYQSFLLHIGRRPSDLHSIDRIDNEKGYEPGNVKWSTKTEQQNNKRNNRMITFRNETMTLSNMARKYGLSPALLFVRIAKGMPLEMALTKEKGKHEKY